jgi:hypothetical protein
MAAVVLCQRGTVDDEVERACKRDTLGETGDGDLAQQMGIGGVERRDREVAAVDRGVIDSESVEKRNVGAGAAADLEDAAESLLGPRVAQRQGHDIRPRPHAPVPPFAISRVPGRRKVHDAPANRRASGQFIQ